MSMMVCARMHSVVDGRSATTTNVMLSGSVKVVRTVYKRTVESFPTR